MKQKTTSGFAFGQYLKCDCCDARCNSLLSALQHPEMPVFITGIASTVARDAAEFYNDSLRHGWKVAYICNRCAIGNKND